MDKYLFETAGTVSGAIKEMIFQLGLQVGSRLPSAEEIATFLGKNISSVQKAIDELSRLGILDVRSGSHIFVGGCLFDGYSQQHDFHSLLQLNTTRSRVEKLLEVRELIEVSLMERLAVALVDDAKFYSSAMQIVSIMEHEARHGRFSLEADRLFHQHLYYSLENPVIDKVLSGFWSAYECTDELLPEAVATPLQTAAIHREILEALHSGHVTRATKAMTTHFAGIRQRINVAERDVLTDAG